MNRLQTLLETDRRLHRRLRAQAPVPRATVDTELHRRIMARVAAGPDRRQPVRRHAPLLAAASALGLAVLAIALVPRPPATAPAPAAPAPVALTPAAAGPVPVMATVPEAALRAEYERLKSDLRKLGIAQ